MSKDQNMDELSVLVYAVVKRHVYALDRETGDVVWHTKLRGLKGEHATMQVDGNDLFVGRAGQVIRLDRWTGDILWDTELKGGGWALPAVAVSGQTGDGVPPMAAGHSAQQSAAVILGG